MPLSYTDESPHTTLNTTLYRAFGSNNEMIIVEVSHDAIADYGEIASKTMASQKYDAGRVTNNKVLVRTTDFLPTVI
jgi:hypothetical protein